MQYKGYLYGYLPFAIGIFIALSTFFLTDGSGYSDWGFGGALVINLVIGLGSYFIGILLILLAQVFIRNISFTDPQWHFYTWAFLVGGISTFGTHSEITWIALVNYVFPFPYIAPITTAIIYIIFKAIYSYVVKHG